MRKLKSFLSWSDIRSHVIQINSAMTFISADLKLELCQKLHFIPWAHFDQVIRNDLLVLFMCFWDVWLDQIGISSHWDFLLFFRKCQTYLGASQASAGFLRILIRIRIGFEFRDCFTFSVGRKKCLCLRHERGILFENLLAARLRNSLKCVFLQSKSHSDTKYFSFVPKSKLSLPFFPNLNFNRQILLAGSLKTNTDFSHLRMWKSLHFKQFAVHWSEFIYWSAEWTRNSIQKSGFRMIIY